MISVSHRRRSFSLVEKINILANYDFHVGKKSAKEIADDLGLKRTTLNSIIENRKAIENVMLSVYCNPNAFHIRSSEHPLVDRALFIWLNNLFENRKVGVVVDGESIKCAAEKFLSLLEGGCTLSPSFIQRWRDRHNVKSYSISGESSSADVESFSQWKLNSLPNILMQFDTRNVFNLDETGLKYLCPLLE
jgi:hypothetical protein